MRIGEALEALENGKRVQRAGWNGKNMWLYYINGSDGTFQATHDDDYILRIDDAEFFDGLGRLPWIGMKTADNFFVPWLASQTDILARDWQIVDGALYDAEIRDAVEHNGHISGKIYGDVKGRFKDGDSITTSRVVERPPANGIYKTANSTYKVTLYEASSDGQ